MSDIENKENTSQEKPDELKDEELNEEEIQKKLEEMMKNLPPANFSTFMMSLSSSAMLNLGISANPMTGKVEKNLPMAKHTIDTIDMIKGKTKGNLDEEEDKFLTVILSDLKLKYVEATKN